ncbi:MAG: hypothetical protein ACR2OR_17585 [Hyphomicrobiales bacterium]
MMRQIFLIVPLLAAMAAAGGCAQKSSTDAVLTSSKRTETVRYNKRDYLVSFKYNDSSQVYDVSVKRKSGPMSGSEKDRENAEQVAASTVSYYSCPQGYRGRPVPGSAAFSSNKTWTLAAKCQPKS